jgi:hemerythrin-like domain-containing protein
MTPNEVAKWMREEHQAVGELAQHLRDQVGVVPRVGLKRWLDATTTHLSEFRGHLSKHFGLEETGGYLEAVTQQSPALSPEVLRLQHEHDEIGRILDSIHGELANITENDPLLIEDFCSRVQNLLRYIKDHEEREDLMIISVFTDDMGHEG